MDDDKRKRIEEALGLIDNPEFMSDPDTAAKALHQKGFFREFTADEEIDELAERAEGGDAEAKREIGALVLRLKRRLLKLKAFW